MIWRRFPSARPGHFESSSGSRDEIAFQQVESAVSFFPQSGCHSGDFLAVKGFRREGGIVTGRQGQMEFRCPAAQHRGGFQIRANVFSRRFRLLRYRRVRAVFS